jgi:hypothetical protein
MKSERINTCNGKMAFDTEKEAQTSATVAKHQRGTDLKVYKCKSCDLWHLSSRFN